MEIIINTICLVVLVILEIALYLMLAGSVIPKILKRRYSLSENCGRGLKKYVYPSGRGISYEPVPAIRKYIDRYLLFTDNGYKYFKCRIDEKVKEFEYTVIMRNNKDKVIDVIEVKAKNVEGRDIEPVLIHGETSYVELILNSVNGRAVENQETAHYRIRDVLIYSLCMAALSFAELIFAYNMINMCFAWWRRGKEWAEISVIYFIIAGLLIGIVCGAMAFLNLRAKKIGWSK